MRTPRSEEAWQEDVNGSDNPDERKALKRQDKGNDNNAIIDLVTNHLKTFSTTTTNNIQIFKNLVIILHKKALTTQDAFCIRDKHKKYKERKGKLKMKK